VLAGGARSGDAGDGAARLDTLDGLSRLVDRSLVVVDHDGATRYRMLETIRQYARDQLVKSGEVAELGAAHLAFFRGIALEGGPALHGRDMIPWLDRLDAESDNLRSALDWAFEADPRAALELCVSLAEYWRIRSIGSEGIEWLGRAVDIARIVAQDASSPRSHEELIMVARVLAAASTSWALWTNWEPAFTWAEEALAVARRTGDPRALSAALASLALASAFAAGDRSPSELLGELVPLLEQTGDWWQIAMMEAGVAIGERWWNPAQSDARLARATEAAQRSENPAAIAFVAKARGQVAGDNGRLADARLWLLEAIERYGEIGAWREVLSTRSDLAHAIRRNGLIDEAEAEYRQTIQDWRRLGNQGAIANQLEAFAYVAVARQNGPRAARLLGAAEALREDSQSPIPGMERPEYDAELGRLREVLDAEALKSTWTEGREMKADEAIAFALAD
jgi:tetratricopeptide (TPR) repeat protein